MPRTKRTDWTAVDWSQQNRDIAKEFHLDGSTISVMRKRLCKPQPKNWHKPKTYPAFIERWSKADWRKTNAEIGRKMKVSTERARQIREMLGKPMPTIKSSFRVRKRLKWIGDRIDRLRGQTLSQAAKFLGVSLAPYSPARQFLDKQTVLRDGRRKHPWHLVNFKLGDAALERIWGIAQYVIAAHRMRQKLGPPEWNGLIYGTHEAQATDRRYLRAIAEERTKVQEYRNGLPNDCNRK